MKLSDIIVYKNLLDDSTPLNTASLTYDKLAPVLHIVENNEIQFASLTEQLGNEYQDVLDCLDNFDQTIEKVKDQVDQLIKQHEPAYYQGSTDLYQQMMANDTIEYTLSRRLSVTTAVQEFLTARIMPHSDWHHAGMIIRPGHEDWIDLLVACDPLYLVDTHADLLEPAVLRYNDQYQRRLRTYVVKESVDYPILNELPERQFGYVLAYNFFNYKTIEIVNCYLEEIYNKLKPGGSFAFTFNDCDRAGGAALCERFFMCYTPGHRVLDHARQLGFQVTQLYRMDAACTWVELVKPGQLTSLRGGQTLGQVFHQSTR